MNLNRHLLKLLLLVTSLFCLPANADFYQAKQKTPNKTIRTKL